MSKITFRADEDLVERLEALDASKSEAMRDALRAYLDDAEPSAADGETSPAVEGDASDTLDEVLERRVDQLVAERVEAYFEGRGRPAPSTAPQDVNVHVTVDGTPGATAEREADAAAERKTPGERAETADETSRRSSCGQCGETVSSDHVYCPNCGEKASHRVFCDCGDELRSDWGFCPGCGRRTPAADVLDRT